MICHAYFREHNEYTRKVLEHSLNCGNDMLNSILRKMSEKDMAKVNLRVKGKNVRELASSEIKGADDISCRMSFVGVIVAGDCVLRCYPKYISEECPKGKLKEEFQQVMDVIEKYYDDNQDLRSKRENPMEEVDDSCGDAFSLLSLMRWLLLDYYENGVYSNNRDIIEVNGEGEILWDKTVNETVALINRGRPYYTNLLTKKHISDEYDYCRRLHEYILTEISGKLAKLELLDLLKLTEVELTDEKREDFGDDGYILYRIERELNAQFNTRKQLLLRNMHDYISQKDTLYDKDGFVFLGVSKFDPVWEKVCAKIMRNQLDKEVKSLRPFRQNVQLDSYYAGLAETVEAEKDENGKSKNKKLKLIDLIEKPTWSKLKNANNSKASAAEEKSNRSKRKNKGKEEKNSTLIPDLISIKKINGKWNFIIFDAKYYAADVIAEADVLAKKEIKKQPKSLPGTPDITKQYLYQLAYQPFIRAHGFKTGNCFLMPTAKEKIGFGGKVYLNMLGKLLLQMLGKDMHDKLIYEEDLIDNEMAELQDIKVRFLPAHMAYNYYLSGEPFPVAELELDSDK